MPFGSGPVKPDRTKARGNGTVRSAAIGTASSGDPWRGHPNGLRSTREGFAVWKRPSAPWNAFGRSGSPPMSWEDLLVSDDAGVADILRNSRRIAVVGIKPEQQSSQPAHFVPRYLQAQGYEIVPVPVYYPDVRSILGEPVYRSVSVIPPPVDLVVVFRRSSDVVAHLDDLLTAHPSAVWLQSGIRDDETARRLAKAGIRVVQDRCTMIEHRLMR